MGVFNLFKSDKDDQFYFNLKADNAKIILQSEGYTTKENCKNGIASVRVNSVIDSRYERKRAINNEFYFVLKAANNEVIGKSETYATDAAMEGGIESVKSNAPGAETDDLTR